MDDPSWKRKLTDLKRGHTCLFCQNREEQISAATAFLEIGLERNEQCVYLADPKTLEEVKTQFKKDGFNTEEEARRGRLKLVGTRHYLEEDGTFNSDKMIAFLNQAINDALKSGFTALRATGDVFWEIGTHTDPDILLIYERILDKVFPNRPLVGLCQYRMADFPVQFIRNAVYTHPVAIVHKSVSRSNPYYDPSRPFAEVEAKHRNETLDILFLNLTRR